MRPASANLFQGQDSALRRIQATSKWLLPVVTCAVAGGVLAFLAPRAQAQGSCMPAPLIIPYGQAGDKPVVGKWCVCGGNRDTIAVFRPSTGKFYIDCNNDGGNAEQVVDWHAVAQPNDIPLSGAWVNCRLSCDEPGLYRPSTAEFILSCDTGLPIPFEKVGDIPFKGNWSGDGDGIAVYRRSEGKAYLDYNNSGGQADKVVTIGTDPCDDPNPLAANIDKPVAGRWLATSPQDQDGLGVFRPEDGAQEDNSTFYLDLELSGGQAELGPWRFGINSDEPLVGDWDGDGFDNLGAYRSSNSTFYLDSTLPATGSDCLNAIYVASIPFSNVHCSEGDSSQACEPNVAVGDVCNCAGPPQEKGCNSVWYRFQWPIRKAVIARTEGSDYDTVLSLTDLDGRVCSAGFDCEGWGGQWWIQATFDDYNDDKSVSEHWSELKFCAEANTQYYLVVTSKTRGGGSLAFTVDSACGDGVADTSCDEECDGADDAACPGRCRSDCTCEVCGDGSVGPGEQCDDWNVQDGDCCGSTCQYEPNGSPCNDGDECTATDQCNGAGQCVGAGTVCGDGVRQPACGEQCDDGNTQSGDCCSYTCQAEDLGTTTCGVGACEQTVQNCVNGIPQTCQPRIPGVEGPSGDPTCSNGVDDDCDGLTDGADPDCGSICGDGQCTGSETTCSCPQDCGMEVCSNGACCVGAGEDTCTCTTDCGVEPCGNGTCCATAGETPSSCPQDCGQCGDGQLNPGEECDDGNTGDGDGCSSTCLCEGTCGDGVPNPVPECNECCDLGSENGAPGSGCTASCGCGGVCTQSRTECATDTDCPPGEGCCGDWVMEQDEECDDGNLQDGDCCSSRCTWESNSCCVPPCERVAGPHLLTPVSMKAKFKDKDGDGKFEVWTTAPRGRRGDFNLGFGQSVDCSTEEVRLVFSENDGTGGRGVLGEFTIAPGDWTRVKLPKAGTDDEICKLSDRSETVSEPDGVAFARIKEKGTKVRYKLKGKTAARINEPTRDLMRVCVHIGDDAGTGMLSCRWNKKHNALKCDSTNISCTPTSSTTTTTTTSSTTTTSLPSCTFTLKWGSYGGGDGQFDGPSGVAVGPDGTVYVADTFNNRIQRFSPNGEFQLKWGSYGSGNGQFYQPLGVAVGPDGTVYVADTFNNRIQRFSPNGEFQLKWDGNILGDAHFDQPLGVAVDGNGNVYVTDAWYESNRVIKFDSSGMFLLRWGGPGEFDSPHDVAVDGSGNVYVADTWNHKIKKFDPNGGFLRQWGSYGTGNGQFHGAKGLAVTAGGAVYVADTPNDRIHIFDSRGTFLQQLGESGTGNGQFYSPRSVAVGPQGNVYIAEEDNNRIQAFSCPFTTTGRAYVTTSSGQVVVIDIARDGVVDSIPLTSSGWGVAALPDGQRVYSADNATVAVIETENNILVTEITLTANSNGNSGIAVSHDGTKLFVPTTYADAVEVISTASNSVAGSLALPAGSQPVNVAVAPDDSRIYVTNRLSGTVAVFDGSYNLIDTVAIGGGTTAVAVHPAGSPIYLTSQSNPNANTLSLLDSISLVVTERIPVEIAPFDVAVDSTGSRVYITNSTSSTVSVIDTATTAVVATIPVGQWPFGLALSRDDAKLYVANSGGKSISVIDTALNEEILQIPLESASDSPRDVVVIP